MNSKLLILLVGLTIVGAGQRGGGGRGIPNPDSEPVPPRAASDIGRAKLERELNVKDAQRLAELADKVRDDLTSSSSFTLSLGMLKNLDEVEKVTKRLRSRLKSGNPRPDPAPMGTDASKR